MPGGFGKGSKNPKSKREYKKWGGHPGTGQPKKIENSKGQKVGLKGLNAEEMSGYNRDRYLEFKERANRPPAPKKTKEEEDHDRALRLARHEERKGRLGVRESLLAAELRPVEEVEEVAEEDTDDEFQLEELIPGHGQEEEEIPEEDLGDEDTLAEAAGPGPGGNEQVEKVGRFGGDGLVDEAADLYHILHLSGKKYVKEMGKALTKIYGRTKDGGKSFNLALIYHEDMKLHRDQQEDNEQVLDGEGNVVGFEPERAQDFTFPERGVRIEEIVAQLQEEGIWDRAEIISEKRLLTREEATRILDPDLFDEIAGLGEKSHDYRDEWNRKNFMWSVYCSADSGDAARLAAGSVLNAIDHVFSGDQGGVMFRGVVFCIIRPPGHHCSRNDPSGFCLLNNCGIAAQYAVSLSLIIVNV